MKRSKSKKKLNSLPIPVKRALHKLGQDIRDARIRRRITMSLLAERASISRTTLTKIEKGNPRVSMESYASVLFVLGLIQHLAEIADVRYDDLGLTLEEENLPRRVRHSKKDYKV